MEYKIELSNQLKAAMKSKDKVLLKTIRGLMARSKEREIEKGDTLTEAEFVKIVQTAAKQRKEAIDLYRKGGRQDLVEIEQAELAILEKYLPKMMSEEEMRRLVKQVIEETGADSMADMGKVMPKLMAATAGKADGKILQQFVREQLG